VQSGDLREALLLAKEIRTHAAKHHQTDASLCDFLGNLSELLYNKNKSTEARQVVEEARKLTWSRLREYGVGVDQQNINGHGDVKVWEDRTPATEQGLEAQLANVSSSAAAGKGQPAAKGGKPAAPAKGQVVEEADETAEAPSLDFSRPIEYKLALADAAANSSSLPPNIYLSGLESAVRFDLRYSQYLTLIEHQHEQAKAVLQDTAKLVARCLYASPQLRFYQALLLAHVNRQIFYDKVLQFQAQYMRNPKYKASFVRHVPHGSIALGHFLVELPNFSEKL